MSRGQDAWEQPPTAETSPAHGIPMLRWYPGLEGQEPIEYQQLLHYVAVLVGGVSFLFICV